MFNTYSTGFSYAGVYGLVDNNWIRIGASSPRGNIDINALETALDKSDFHTEPTDGKDLVINYKKIYFFGDND